MLGCRGLAGSFLRVPDDLLRVHAKGGWRRVEEGGGGWRRMEEAGGGWRRLEGGEGHPHATRRASADPRKSESAELRPQDFPGISMTRSLGDLSVKEGLRPV